MIIPVVAKILLVIPSNLRSVYASDYFPVVSFRKGIMIYEILNLNTYTLNMQFIICRRQLDASKTGNNFIKKEIK